MFLTLLFLTFVLPFAGRWADCSRAQWLHRDFWKKHGLSKTPKEKLILGHQGLLALLCYHWKFDVSTFPLERNRVQLAAVLLTIAYTTLRPGSVIESVCYPDSNGAIHYRDCKLKLLKPRGGKGAVLVLEPKTRLEKGRRKSGHQYVPSPCLHSIAYDADAPTIMARC